MVCRTAELETGSAGRRQANRKGLVIVQYKVYLRSLESLNLRQGIQKVFLHTKVWRIIIL